MLNDSSKQYFRDQLLFACGCKVTRYHPADGASACGEWGGERRLSWEILGTSTGCGEHGSHTRLARMSHTAAPGCKMAGNYVSRKKMK